MLLEIGSGCKEIKGEIKPVSLRILPVVCAYVLLIFLGVI